MRTLQIIFVFLIIQSSALASKDQDTIIPSKNKFKNSSIFVPRITNETELVTLFMDYLKTGKKTIGFLHQDELDMIEEKKLTEKRFFLDEYKIISVGKRQAIVKTFTSKGAGLSCKILTLRYYKNMYGFLYLVPGKVQKFEKKMGDITLKEVYINTWTSEKKCN